MAKAKQPESGPRGGLIRGAARTVAVALTAVIIVWLTLWGFAGTAGFRKYLEGRIAKAVGIDVEIVGSRATLGGTLILREVRSAGMVEPGRPGIRIGTLALRPNWRALLGGSPADGLGIVTADDWSVHFQMDEAGGWQPEGFDAVTSWLGKWGSLSVPRGPAFGEPHVVSVDDVTGHGEETAAGTFDPAAWSGAEITLRGGKLLWSAADGRQIAVAEGTTFTFRPLVLPTRRADHFHLVIGHASLPDADVDDIDVELLKTGDLYLVINLAARRQRRAVVEGSGPPADAGLAAGASVPPLEPARESMLFDAEPPSAPNDDMEWAIRARLREAVSDAAD